LKRLKQFELLVEGEQQLAHLEQVQQPSQLEEQKLEL